MKVLDTYWFINGGIVRVETEYDGIEYYIRGVQDNQWSTPENDAQYIADWGNMLPNAVGDVLFGFDAVRNGDAVLIPKTKEHAEAMVRVGLHYLKENENV